MAPEVLCHQNHTIAVDYFALGVICYELMLGKRPYRGKSRREIREHVLGKQVLVSRKEAQCSNWSIESVDFINRLIQRKPVNRLGSNGSNEIKEHPWFKGFPWADLRSKKLPAPYIPLVNDVNSCEGQATTEEDEM